MLTYGTILIMRLLLSSRLYCTQNLCKVYVCTYILSKRAYVQRIPFHTVICWFLTTLTICSQFFPRYQISVPPLTRFNLSSVTQKIIPIQDIRNHSESDVMECEDTLIFATAIEMNDLERIGLQNLRLPTDFDHFGLVRSK